MRNAKRSVRRKVLLLALGLTPFLLGRVMSRYMMAYPDTLLPYLWIAILFLILWGGLSFLLKGKTGKTSEVLIFLNAVAAFDLLLVGVQELLLHAYWLNAAGVWSQLYYLPVIHVGFRLTDWSHSVFSAYAASFLLMAGASFLGCKLREKVTN